MIGAIRAFQLTMTIRSGPRGHQPRCKDRTVDDADPTSASVAMLCEIRLRERSTWGYGCNRVVLLSTVNARGSIFADGVPWAMLSTAVANSAAPENFDCR